MTIFTNRYWENMGFAESSVPDALPSGRLRVYKKQAALKSLFQQSSATF